MVMEYLKYNKHIMLIYTFSTFQWMPDTINDHCNNLSLAVVVPNGLHK